MASMSGFSRADLSPPWPRKRGILWVLTAPPRANRTCLGLACLLLQWCQLSCTFPSGRFLPIMQEPITFRFHAYPLSKRWFPSVLWDVYVRPLIS